LLNLISWTVVHDIDVMEEFALSEVEVWTFCYTRASKAKWVIVILSDDPTSIAQEEVSIRSDSNDLSLPLSV